MLPKARRDDHGEPINVGTPPGLPETRRRPAQAKPKSPPILPEGVTFHPAQSRSCSKLSQ